jgi:hypothetical protein
MMERNKNMGVSEAYKTMQRLVNTLKGFFDLSKWFVREPADAKPREKANVGKQSKAVERRRARNKMAKQSRRINWMVAKGISIRQSR